MSTTPYHVVQVTPLGHRGQTQISFGPLPDECPECHAVATPNKIDAAHAPLSVGCLLYVSFQCPSQKCGAMFVGKYVQSQDNSYALQSVRPRNPKPSVLPECVQKLSPEFVRIYDQALAAETYNLDALTGIGLRKVLEFLVKDFAKQESPGKQSETEAEFLGTRIKKYIDDANVKALITEGSGGMPPFGDSVSNDDKDNIVAYLKTL